MTRLVYDPETVGDFDRIFDHFARHDPMAARETIGHIVEAMNILVKSPLLGRPTAGGKRELVIGRGTRGFVALYLYLPQEDLVWVLAIRGQREAGYKRG
jgi:toxin ParE1/3/4